MFLPYDDELAKSINEQGLRLYNTMYDVPVDDFNFAEFPLFYYKVRHKKRKFFSVETAAHLLYNSIKMVNKPLNEIVILEYGAGIGTIFLLAKLIGVKTIIYQDILEEMAYASKRIAEYIDIDIEHYLVGDHRQTLRDLEKLGIQCDLVLSRNVVEHIYDLKDFYEQFSKYQPNAIIYFSTTANLYNIPMRWRHYLIHRRHEKNYFPLRKEYIKKLAPELSEQENSKLAKATRGIAGEDFTNAVLEFSKNKIYPDNSKDVKTNTCELETGMWQEHMVPKEFYIRSIGPYYNVSFKAGIWDTHYKSSLMNAASKFLNKILKKRQEDLSIAPYMYIIAEPKKLRQK